MNRTDRLHAITEELRRAGRHGRTATRLAGRFEVSARTVKRDVAALQQGGLPVWAQPGPGGGYVLDAAATLPPVNLTPGQAVAVAVALATATDAPYGADGQAALEKVYDVMDPAARARADQLGSRLWIQREESPASPAQRIIEQALQHQRVVVLDYSDRHGRRTRRRVDPHLLAHTGDRWYLIGWCQRREGVRWFRLDRVQAAHLTADAATDHDPTVFGTPPPDARPVREGPGEARIRSSRATSA